MPPQVVSGTSVLRVHVVHTQGHGQTNPSASPRFDESSQLPCSHLCPTGQRNTQDRLSRYLTQYFPILESWDFWTCGAPLPQKPEV